MSGCSAAVCVCALKGDRGRLSLHCVCEDLKMFSCMCVVESRGREKRLPLHILTSLIYHTLRAHRLCTGVWK